MTAIIGFLDSGRYIRAARLAIHDLLCSGSLTDFDGQPSGLRVHVVYLVYRMRKRPRPRLDWSKLRSTKLRSQVEARFDAEKDV